MTIYFIEMEKSGFIKIGYTKSDADKRMAQLQTGQPDRLRLLGTIPGEMADEKSLHLELKKFRIGGEWFIPETMEIVRHLISRQGPWYICRELDINNKKMEMEWLEAFSKSEIDADPFNGTELELKKAVASFHGLEKQQYKHFKRYGVRITDKNHSLFDIINHHRQELKTAAKSILAYENRKYYATDFG